jgi:hypothetical protein
MSVLEERSQKTMLNKNKVLKKFRTRKAEKIANRDKKN